MNQVRKPDVYSFDTADLRERQFSANARYYEFLRQPSVSAGLYRLSAGQEDPQAPHEQDELYYVLAGKASFESAGTRVPVHPGSVLFVPARFDHRFRDITEDLLVLVVFAPAET